jgi:hypothetical protein
MVFLFFVRDVEGYKQTFFLHSPALLKALDDGVERNENGPYL